MIEKTKGFSELARKASLMPQEVMIEVKNKKKQQYIGVPKEISFQENRIALTPQSVGLLVNNGHEVRVETGAGAAANFPDSYYSEKGANIEYDPRDIYKCDIVMKVEPPSIDEIKMMQNGQTLISALQLSTLKKEFIEALLKKRITAIAYEYIKDEHGTFPVIRSMSEIVGSTAILIAAEYLSNVSQGKGQILGGVSGIPPTEVLILGAGTVGEFAAKTALGLGANVKVFDKSIHKLGRLQNNIGARIFTSVLQPVILEKALKATDVAVGAIHGEGRSPCVVTEAMVSKMKPQSVIIDVSIDHGGCFETSVVTNHTQPVFKKHDVIHYCVPNIASRVSRTASYALSNIFTPVLLMIGESGGIKTMLWEKSGVRNGVYMYEGNITNKYISDQYQLNYKELDLLIAAHI
ncbi:alanine dehydrogenase [Candidatus Amoebophilus asiaticus]|nr:alanine dehydrogenase [Candidatus Amoebophilus asiaticus]